MRTPYKPIFPIPPIDLLALQYERALPSRKWIAVGEIRRPASVELVHGGSLSNRKKPEIYCALRRWDGKPEKLSELARMVSSGSSLLCSGGTMMSLLTNNVSC